MLADSLDAEVKRWSTGKEGNLRALLSTLQYVRKILNFVYESVDYLVNLYCSCSHIRGICLPEVDLTLLHATPRQ